MRYNIRVDMFAEIETDSDAAGTGVGICVWDVGETGGVGEADGQGCGGLVEMSRRGQG